MGVVESVSNPVGFTSEMEFPTPRELPNKPLVEAIFELRWAIQPLGPDPSSGRDPGSQILLGRFYDKVSGEFPQIVNLPAAQIPEEMVAHTVRHQFRPAPNQWPLLQLGPGILTVNETAGYNWESFRSLVSRSLAALFESYPTKVADLRPNRLLLRYINAIPFEGTPTDALSFLREKLHTEIGVDSLLYEAPGGAQPPTGIGLNLAFPLTHPHAVLNLSLATGLSGGKRVIVWQLTSESTPEFSGSNPSQIEEWVVSAHNVIEHWFFTLARGELLERFGGPNV